MLTVLSAPAAAAVAASAAAAAVGLCFLPVGMYSLSAQSGHVSCESELYLHIAAAAASDSVVELFDSGVYLIGRQFTHATAEVFKFLTVTPTAEQPPLCCKLCPHQAHISFTAPSS